MDLNKVMIIGNVVRDPDIRTTPSGQSVASFSIATNLVWKDKEGKRQQKAEFHNVVAWRRLGEIVGQYVKKGGKIYLEGRLETRSWDDQNGIKRFRTEIIADNMILLDKASGRSTADAAPAFSNQPEPQATKTPDQSSGEEEINIEDIPF
ncbi:MAG: single-stranded DNA-binding protein [Patescibacteria group bacterium]